MQVITVAPVVRGALKETLTYFSKDPIDVGMVVIVPVRTREIPAIVLESRNVSSEKSSLRSSDYAIRKITRHKPRRILLPAFLKAIEETANFSAQKLGEVLFALTPKTILDAHLEGELIEPQSSTPTGRFEIFAIQGSTEMRLEAYQRLVRESFVRKESVFMCVPTEDDVERLSKELGRGIEDYTFSFHGSRTKKRTLVDWKKVSAEKHAVLVVATPQHLALPRYFKTIVLDEEHSHAWKMVSRPFLDLRVFVENYARAGKSSFIIGSPLLRAETYARYQASEMNEFGRIALHARSELTTILTDPRKQEKAVRETTGKRELIIFTREVRELIEKASSQHERVLLIVGRKGLAPITACSDCGTLIRCPACDTPLVIHKKEIGNSATNIFVCHGCGFMRAPENNVNETCPKCSGWRLQGVGIGIDLVCNEVARLFPKSPRFVLDGDHAKTRAQAKKIIAQFEKSESGILVATPMAVPLLGTTPHTAIISIDSLFAIPDIRMSERIFALVLALREKTTDTFIIQTRADDTALFEQAFAGNLLDFTENELGLRKIFSYPPYGTIIKITLHGKRALVAEEMARLKTFLENYAPVVPGSMAREPKNMFRMHLILKLKEGVWPDNELLAKLRALPMQFTIEVNPDHLL